jgi:DNA repair exonuclease SbcCD nuclease subunit
MTEKLRIAHCSDIHLDGDHYMGGTRESAVEFFRAAFAETLARMNAHRPDLILLAGDLFDTNSASPETINWAMEILGAQPVPVVMIPGNHDCLAENAIFKRHDFGRIGNVEMLSSEDGRLARLNALDVAVWGKGMVDHSPDYSPLGGCPERPTDCKWFIGLGHGIFVPRGEATDRSSPIPMAEIETSPCDYLALGHHHAAMDVSANGTAAAFCGSPTDTIGRGATYITAELSTDTAPKVEIHEIPMDD